VELFVLVGLLAIGLACRPESREPPVVTSRPAPESRVATSRAVEPPPVASTRPAPDPNSARVEIRALTDPQEGWLRIEAVKANAPGASAAGRFFPDENRLAIHTDQVERFSIDLSALPIRWDRRVVLRIDQVSAELSRRNQTIVHFEVTPAGDWVPVKP
jgi:hypothetical protein